MITIYSTGCPRCKVLKQKLDNKSIQYRENTSVDDMLELGITHVPVLCVDGIMMQFTEAVQWVNNIQTKGVLGR